MHLIFNIRLRKEKGAVCMRIFWNTPMTIYKKYMHFEIRRYEIRKNHLQVKSNFHANCKHFFLL